TAATAVLANVTVVSPGSPGFLTFFPAGSSFPLVSTLNYSANQVRSNNAILPVGTDGGVACVAGLSAGTRPRLLPATRPLPARRPPRARPAAPPPPARQLPRGAERPPLDQHAGGADPLHDRRHRPDPHHGDGLHWPPEPRDQRHGPGDRLSGRPDRQSGRLR